jgi:hypothetical protein
VKVIAPIKGDKSPKGKSTMRSIHNSGRCLRGPAFFGAMLVFTGAALAGYNDYAITVRTGDVTITPRDAKTATLTFDLSWRNSWRHEVNHDAVWVFLKARAEGSKQWRHVRLAADKVLNPDGYGYGESSAPLEFLVPDGRDGFTGMFVRTADYGYGDVAAKAVKVLWDLTDARIDASKAEVRAHGVEMVYVSEGPFWLGGGDSLYRFYKYTDGTQDSLAYRVTSAGAIPTGRQPGRLWAAGKAQPEDGGEIPAAFPNGYAAIYCMKTHIAMRQYADFLNTLSPEQAAERYGNQFGRSGTAPDQRYGGGQNADHGCSKLSWADGATWGAWAGLRPMTELEWEKVSRGPMAPGWKVGDGLNAPSYWDVKDWCGWRTMQERPVTVANAKGRQFRGTHGSGEPVLPADWPQADALGAGTRGIHGGQMARSYRLHAATTFSGRGESWRGVRTAPKLEK